jgi:hypothetical protein
MTWFRNDRNNLTAWSAEEDRRRAEDAFAREHRHAGDEAQAEGTHGERRPSRTRRILGRIRRALGR